MPFRCASPFGLRWIAPLLAAGMFAVCSPHRAFAQVVTGTVRIATDIKTDSTRNSAPASDAVVVLLDSTGAVVAGAITHDDGHFALRAPAAGTYRALARRIGLAPDSSARILIGDRVTAITLTLHPFAAQLDPVHVDESRRCAITPAAGLVALQLWQDVQSALTAAIVTQAKRNNAGLILTRFKREMEPNNGHVIQSTTWQATNSTFASFSALPADTLVAHGFVIKEQRDLVYYAPDARTLLSDAFARTHCFRPRTDDGHPGMVGLTFDAVRSKKHHTQVSGTLWLDSTTRELRYLEFRYLDADRRDNDDTDETLIATGRIEYDRLPDGTWIIRHWKLHIPMIGIRDRNTFVVSIWELGGDATLAPEKK